MRSVRALVAVLLASSSLLALTSLGTLAVFTDSSPVDANDFATATQFGRLATGTYTGDGLETRKIAGLGFQPNVVIVKGDTAEIGVIRTSTMSGDASKEMTGATALVTNRVKSLDERGFTVGSHAQVNASGVTYYWTAFMAFSDRLTVGSYTGNGTSQTVGLKYSPEYVIVMSQAAHAPVHRSSTMPSTFRFDETAALDNGITSMSGAGGGFSVGSSAEANASATDYHYLAWNETSGSMDVGSYAGNGTDDRSITGTGFAPQYVIVKANSSTTAPVHRPAALTGDSTLRFTANPNAADAVQVLESNGFQVGTLAAVNTADAAYHYVAFRDP